MSADIASPSDANVTIDDVIVAPPVDDEIVDPRAMFASEPDGVELEIGCGKGGFLLYCARAFPQRCFLGIEWANRYFRFAADRMARWKVGNVRIMRTDARDFVVRNLAPDTLSALHVYHPDPWPKKRHHKRRLFQPALVEAAVRALQPGARLAVQSDHEEYYAWIRERLDARPELQEVAFRDLDGPTAVGTVNTNYEVKYRQAGRIILRAAYRRR